MNINMSQKVVLKYLQYLFHDLIYVFRWFRPKMFKDELNYNDDSDEVESKPDHDHG